MPHYLTIGLYPSQTDPFWIQVEDAIRQKAKEYPIQLVGVTPPNLDGVADRDAQMALVEDLLALEVNALIGWWWPENLALPVLEAGIPIVHLSETEVDHPLSVSPHGLFEVARLASEYVAQQLGGSGRVLAVGGLLRPQYQDDGRSRMAGIRAGFAAYPHIEVTHIPSIWDDAAYPQIHQAMRHMTALLDGIIGFSDPLALMAHAVAQEVGLLRPQTVLVGINGDPMALSAIARGEMAATVETDPAVLGNRAVELAYRAARREPLPTHYPFACRLVTSHNVAEVAAQRLMAIATLPNHLVGANLSHEQQRMMQLETSLAISHRIGSLLDPQQLAQEIADLIRTQYGYDRAHVLRWVEADRSFVREGVDAPVDEAHTLPLGQAGIVGQALLRNEAIFVPNTQRSLRFSADPRWPDTHARVVLPIRLGAKMLGVLDLHCTRPSRHLDREQLIGLQSLADQLGIAMHNAHLYQEALELRRVAEKADQLKTRLLANVSHELRTPVQDILRASTLSPAIAAARFGDAWQAVEQSLQQVKANADYLLRMIDDLLDLSRAEISELSLAPIMVDTKSVLGEVACAVNEDLGVQRAPRHQLALPARLPLLYADPVRLRQIIQNLLEYASRVAAHGDLVLGAEVAPPFMHIWVASSEPTLAVDGEGRIFQPFAGLAQAQPRQSGIGLGLAIAHRLVMLHHGALTVDSSPGQGSAFHIYLPLPNLLDRPALPSGRVEPVLAWLATHGEPDEDLVALCQRKGLALRPVRHHDELDHLALDTQPVALAWDAATGHADDWQLINHARRNVRLSHLPFLLFAAPELGGHGSQSLTAQPAPRETLSKTLASLCLAPARGPIVILDDDAEMRRFYQRIVAQHLPVAATYATGSGADALALCEREIPGLVVLDLHLCDMDGLTVVDRLRADERTRRVPILVITGHMLEPGHLERLKQQPQVMLYAKDILTVDELGAAFQRALAATDTLPAHTSALVKHAVIYLQQFYTDPITRADLANAVGVSESYLSQIFRQDLGISLWEYLNRYRVDRAKALLRQTTHSMTEVASAVGIDDPAYFSRIFHKQVGMSPSAYRVATAANGIS